METKWPRIAFLSHMVSRASNNKAHNSPSVEKHCHPRSFQIPPTCFQACLKQPSNLPDASRWPRDASKIPTKMIQNASNSSQGIRKTFKTLKPLLKVCSKLSQTPSRSLKIFGTVRWAACFARGQLNIEARILFSQLFETLANGNNPLKKCYSSSVHLPLRQSQCSGRGDWRPKCSLQN